MYHAAHNSCAVKKRNSDRRASPSRCTRFVFGGVRDSRFSSDFRRRGVGIEFAAAARTDAATVFIMLVTPELTMLLGIIVSVAISGSVPRKLGCRCQCQGPTSTAHWNPQTTQVCVWASLRQCTSGGNKKVAVPLRRRHLSWVRHLHVTAGCSRIHKMQKLAGKKHVDCGVLCCVLWCGARTVGRRSFGRSEAADGSVIMPTGMSTLAKVGLVGAAVVVAAGLALYVKKVVEVASQGVEEEKGTDESSVRAFPSRVARSLALIVDRRCWCSWKRLPLTRLFVFRLAGYRQEQRSRGGSRSDNLAVHPHQHSE